MAGELLLDTSIVIDVLAFDPAAEQVIGDAERLFLPVPALGELQYGVRRSQRPRDSEAQLSAFLGYVEILGCDADTALFYAEVKDGLRAKGRLIPENDMWIAAVARQYGLAVATRDEHFRNVAGLPLVSW